MLPISKKKKKKKGVSEKVGGSKVYTSIPLNDSSSRRTDVEEVSSDYYVVRR